MKYRKLLLSAAPVMMFISPFHIFAEDFISEQPDFEQMSADAEESQMTREELFEAIELAHQDFTSVASYTDANVTIDANGTQDESTLQHTGIYQMDPDGNPIAMYSLTESSANNEDNFGEAIITTKEPKMFYYRNQADAEFEFQELAGGQTGEINPHYPRLITGMFEIQDSLKVTENETHYILTLEDPEAEVIASFQEQYSMSFEIPEGAELAQDVIFLINKETNYLDGLYLDFTYSTEGQDLLNMNIQTVMSQWNAVENEDIDSKLP